MTLHFAIETCEREDHSENERSNRTSRVTTSLGFCNCAWQQREWCMLKEGRRRRVEVSAPFPVLQKTNVSFPAGWDIPFLPSKTLDTHQVIWLYILIPPTRLLNIPDLVPVPGFNRVLWCTYSTYIFNMYLVPGSEDSW
jgi:hypothetical protein